MEWNLLFIIPKKTKGAPFKKGIRKSNNGLFTEAFGSVKENVTIENKDGYRLPRSVQYFTTAEGDGKFHPTQKPLALCKYLIKTYTKEGEIVLDNCIGGGTTAIACVDTKRNFIGIEKDEENYNVGCNRLLAVTQLNTKTNCT